MPDSTAQSYTTHVRWLPAFHFFALPVLLINAIVMIVAAARQPSLTSAWAALVGIAMPVGIFFARWMPLRVQDRVIRLEESLRLTRLLPTRGADIASLTQNQLVAIRFAGDEEVPSLLDRIRKGEIRSQKEIKQAVKTWRPDHLRA